MPTSVSKLPHATSTAKTDAATDVRVAERLLRFAGFDPGKVDGKPTPEFRAALRSFQRAWGLADTGTVNAATLKKLRQTATAKRNHGKRYVTTGMKSQTVRTVEARLKKLGYDVGKVDGIYSRSTFEAAKAFKADHPRIPSHSGGMGAKAQEVLAHAVKAPHGGGKDRDTNVRAVTFNWPSRYHKGGEAADEALFDRLSKNADVMGFPEFGWGHTKITDHEAKWSFYNPNPPHDGDNERAGQVLAWRKDKFKLVEKGTTLLNRPTKIQPNAAGPTRHRSKSVIWAKLRSRETGEVWTVAVVHFVPSKHLGGAAAKLWRKQRDGLAKWIAAQGPRTLVMGDFNGEWNDAIARPLHKVARAQTAASHGKRKIDWILRSKDLEAKGNGKALSNSGQSDHHPVKGVVRG